MPELTDLAPAKVNLFLHVGPVDSAGYHPLASLVAFADIGDRITVRPAERLSLSVEGPFAGAVGPDDDNLILRALRALGDAAGTGEPALAVTLDKRLPVAAGLGGGSADAGTALKLARAALDLDIGDDALAAVAGTLGADGPMCLHARAVWAEGRGDRLEFEPRLPALPVVLINPDARSPTGPVYQAYDSGPVMAADRPDAPSSWDRATVIHWLTAQRNDLERPARTLQSAIGAALVEARELAGVRLARMSGSGATVFALFDTARAAAEAAGTLRARRPNWWVISGILS